MAGVKWSDDSKFIPGGEAQIGDTIVGLRGGKNYKFDFPSDGIKDGNGNYLMQWATVGPGAVNFITLNNSLSGSPVILESDGTDANIDITVNTKGTGKVTINADVDGLTQLDVDNIEIDANTISSTDLNGDINIDPNGTGSVVIPAPVSGITQLDVDNIRIDGNTVSSTDTNGNINIDPDGTGNVVIPAPVNSITQLDVDNIRIDGNTISSTDAAGPINVAPDTTGIIDLDSDTILVGQDIQHKGDTDNKVVFGTDTQDFQTGASSRLDISDSGVRLGGANSRVTTILDEDTMSSDSATALATQQSIKAYVDTEVAGAGFQSVQTFTANGTWTKPAGINKVLVIVVGGGGGSGGVPATGASTRVVSSGGGGGGTAMEFIDVTGTSSETVTIGAGGTGGAAGQNDGNTGGTSSFGAFCSATGGAGGVSNAAVDASTGFISNLGGLGGAGSGGDQNFNGDDGGPSFFFNAALLYSHGGGGSFLGGFVAPVVTESTPVTGRDYGTGGAGIFNGGSDPATAGGDGADGIVIVYEYA